MEIVDALRVFAVICGTGCGNRGMVLQTPTGIRRTMTEIIGRYGMSPERVHLLEKIGLDATVGGKVKCRLSMDQIHIRTQLGESADHVESVFRGCPVQWRPMEKIHGLEIRPVANQPFHRDDVSVDRGEMQGRCAGISVSRIDVGAVANQDLQQLLMAILRGNVDESVGKLIRHIVGLLSSQIHHLHHLLEKTLSTSGTAV